MLNVPYPSIGSRKCMNLEQMQKKINKNIVYIQQRCTLFKKWIACRENTVLSFMRNLIPLYWID